MPNSNGIKLPAEVGYILETLCNNGFDAYIVGGCVRDSILGRKPGDWDITTNAKPEETKKLFNKTIDTGLKHGTVTVVVNGQNFEVTTFRIEGEYKDFRRPAEVEFAASIEDDLGRRDFTINAVAYNSLKGFVDPFNGIEDMHTGIIKTVGNPDERFGEDALRMLRAIRFSAQLGFEIEDGTLRSIARNCGLINNISSERIREELTKTLLSANPDRFRLYRDTGLLEHTLPEFDKCFDTEQHHPYHIFNVAFHSLKSVSLIDNDMVLRWTMLLHDLGKAVTKTTDKEGIDHFYGHPVKSVEIAKRIFNRLRFDNRTAEKALRLIKEHDRRIEPSCKAVRKAVKAVGEDIFLDLLKVQEADKKAQNPEMLGDRLERLESIRKMFLEIKETNQCISLKDLAISGADLIDAGFRPGKEIGTTLDKLLDAVLDNPKLNTKEQLLELSKNLLTRT